MSETREIVSFDYAIKYVLRQKADFVVLEGFLSELLARQVKVMEILESESNKDDQGSRIARVDLKARIDDGEIVIFEIQYHYEADFFGKLLFNASTAVVEQMREGSKFYIKKVYMIAIAYINFHNKLDYLFRAQIKDFVGVQHQETIPFTIIDRSESVRSEIHPEYFLILPNMFDDQIRVKFDEWVYTLKNSKVRSDFTAAGIKEAGAKLDVLKMTPEERRSYNRFWQRHRGI